MADEKLPAIHLYPGDWLRDEVAGCSLDAQGLWLRMLFVMHDSDRYGYLSKDGMAIPPGSIARRCGCTLEQYMALLTELTSDGVPSTTEDGIIYSRRMVRDAEKRKLLHEIRSKSGSKGGRPPSKKSKRKAKQKQTPENEDDKDIENALKVVPDYLIGNLEEIKSWLVYKKEKRQMYKPTGLGALWRALKAIPADRRRAAIDRSMGNNWDGLFPAKGENGKANGAVAADTEKYDNSYR